MRLVPRDGTCVRACARALRACAPANRDDDDGGDVGIGVDVGVGVVVEAAADVVFDAAVDVALDAAVDSATRASAFLYSTACVSLRACVFQSPTDSRKMLSASRTSHQHHNVL